MPKSVLGIDVGYSQKKDTTSFCLLQWDSQKVEIKTKDTSSDLHKRERDLRSLLPKSSHLLAVAIDGPLTKDLKIANNYRAAEALLSCGVFQKRGKPGQTNSGMGQNLHKHATILAGIIMDRVKDGYLSLEKSRHLEAISEFAITEAFPNQFLAALIAEKDLPRKLKNTDKWSDVYWEACVREKLLVGLMKFLLPGRTAIEFEKFTHHEQRAAIVCALTALGVALGKWVGVGDPSDGDITLPSFHAWGKAFHSSTPWMELALKENLSKVRAGANHPNHRNARINTPKESWIAYDHR